MTITGARDFAWTLGTVYTASLLIQNAIRSKSDVDTHIALTWIELHPLCTITYPGSIEEVTYYLDTRDLLLNRQIAFPTSKL